MQSIKPPHHHMEVLILIAFVLKVLTAITYQIEHLWQCVTVFVGYIYSS